MNTLTNSPDQDHHTPRYQSQGDQTPSLSQEGETPRQLRAQFAHSKVSDEEHIDLFDNKWRKEAAEEDQLMKDCYAQADQARKQDDHHTANQYVNDVSIIKQFTGLV